MPSRPFLMILLLVGRIFPAFYSRIYPNYPPYPKN